jgi:hypothetical protein
MGNEVKDKFVYRLLPTQNLLSFQMISGIEFPNGDLFQLGIIVPKRSGAEDENSGNCIHPHIITLHILSTYSVTSSYLFIFFNLQSSNFKFYLILKIM